MRPTIPAYLPKATNRFPFDLQLLRDHTIQYFLPKWPAIIFYYRVAFLWYVKRKNTFYLDKKASIGTSFTPNKTSQSETSFTTSIPSINIPHP